MSFKTMNWREPAVLRGIIVAALSLAAALGFTTSTEINGAAEALVPILAVLIPIAQSVWTRARVFSPAAVAKLRAAGPQTPGVADHAAPEVA